MQHGFEDVYNLLGGINAWQQLHLPIVLPAPEETPAPMQTPVAGLPYRIKPYRVPDSINPEIAPTRRGYLNNRYGTFTIKRAKNDSNYYSYPRFVSDSYSKYRRVSSAHLDYYIFRQVLRSK